jgi:COMPASS component SPP1
MVGCDKCDEWYHFKCVGVTKEEVNSFANWFCFSCRKSARQCARPECCVEAREGSKYCSESCGMEFNKQRYHRFFLPKWQQLEKKHSRVRGLKINELESLEIEREQVLDLIGQLKREKEELEESIKQIKEQAMALGPEPTQKEQQKDDFFCPSCGTDSTADKYFKHLINCYKKQENNFVSYLTTANVVACEKDPNPDIYCTKMVDKKKNWHCPNIAIICPLHANYNYGPDEICSSPLIDAQDTLVPDGNYCRKLKKDCILHYNWDRFRLASKDYARAEAFQRLQRIDDDIFRTQSSLNETYGGVIGIMLHNTIDHQPEDAMEDQEMIDMQISE